MEHVEDFPLDLESEREIDEALARARHRPDLPGAVSAIYREALDIVELGLDGGRRLLIPRVELEGLQDASTEQLSRIEIHAGVDIAWPDLDVDHYLPSLLAGQYGSRRWMRKLERMGIPEGINNSGFAVASRRAAQAMYPLMEPFSQVEGSTLHHVGVNRREDRWNELILTTGAGAFSVAIDPSGDGIATDFHPHSDVETDLSQCAPWADLIGNVVGRAWLSIDQRGFLDTFLVAFNSSRPEISVTVEGNALRVALLSEVSQPQLDRPASPTKIN
jgi:hypothetical protein